MTWLDRFFETYYRHRPVDATFTGVHDHDTALPDAGGEAVESMLAETRGLAKEIEALPAVEREGVDAELARGALEIHAWELESGYFLRRNPAWYTGEAIFGVFSLLLRDFAPLDERLGRAQARLRGVPALLARGADNVRSAPRAWIERAIRECEGALAFLREGIGHLPASAELEEAATLAAGAFESYRKTLSRDVETSDAYACGDDAFDLLLRRAHCLDWNARDVLERAEAALEAGAGSYRDALAKIEERHPSRERYYDRYRELWEASRDLARERKLLTWPDWPVDFVPRPTWARSAAPSLYFLFYRSPAPLEPPSRVDYLVTPLEPELSDEEAERILRATNDGVIKLNHVVHHGGIGHHVQNWHAVRASSRIGRVAAVDGASRIAMLGGGTMAEGWACYATDLMAEAGFLTDLELHALEHARLRMAARAIADVKLHSGAMSFEEAERFYVETTAMSPAAARAEVTKNTMFPAAALIYFVGSTLIHELRRERERALGAAFVLSDFHDELLSHGSIPVPLIARQMRSASP